MAPGVPGTCQTAVNPERADNGCMIHRTARRRCICDGGAYIDKMPADWRPFIVTPGCPTHGGVAR